MTVYLLIDYVLEMARTGSPHSVERSSNTTDPRICQLKLLLWQIQEYI